MKSKYFGFIMIMFMFLMASNVLWFDFIKNNNLLSLIVGTANYSFWFGVLIQVNGDITNRGEE